MGGKSQQRVAGNKKPTNSDRIRQLLIEKTGNDGMITFSALATPSAADNLPMPTQNPFIVASRSKQTCLQASSDTKPSASPKSSQTQQPNQAPLEQSNQLLGGRTITKLVVKKIGGRDCFTRVKYNIPDTSLHSDHEIGGSTDQVEAAVGCEVELEDKLKDASRVEVESSEIEESQDETKNYSDEDIEDSPKDFDAALDRLQQFKQPKDHDYQSLDQMTDDDIGRQLDYLKLLRSLVREHHKEMSIEEWDIVIRSIYCYITLISNCGDILNVPANKLSICLSLFKFINQLIVLAKTYKNSNSSSQQQFRDEFPMLQSLLEDWNNFHLSNMYQDLTAIFFKLAVSLDSQERTKDISKILTQLSTIIQEQDAKLIILSSTLDEFKGKTETLDPEFELPSNSQFHPINGSRLKGFAPICNLLNRNDRSFCILAHSMLSRTMATLCDNSQVKCIELEEVSLLPPERLFTILVSKDLVMSALLSDYKVGQVSVAFESDTDAYNCALSYLLVFDLVIQFILRSPNDVRHNIIHSLKNLKLLFRLLDNIFVLLPPLSERNSLVLDQKGRSLSDFLRNPLNLTPTKRPHNEIELTALHLYFSIACHMPITVRKWYNNNSNRRLCNLVLEYTTKHISQVICSLEMDTVQAECQSRNDSDLIIKARPSAREVYAFYSGDEFKVELTIKLPDNYPLGPVLIDGGKRIGVTDVKKWRNWLLQLTKFLAHQNGPILDGIDLWRRNIDKGVEGVEKCMICFSILHSNYQLPKKKCRTCSKMFHHFCVSKWFVSSRNTTCPLCRNIW